MRDEYDFSKGERGRFHRPDAALTPPVHLDSEVLEFLTARAKARGVSATHPPTTACYFFSGGFGMPSPGMTVMMKPVGFSSGPKGPGTLFFTGGSVRR
jgi:hypothetical protein